MWIGKKDGSGIEWMSETESWVKYSRDRDKNGSESTQ